MKDLIPSPRETLAPKRILLLGASGTIGRATLAALLERGHDVVCLLRKVGNNHLPAEAVVQLGDATDPGALSEAFANCRFDAVVSCMASRTGTPRDAWAVDHGAHMAVLGAAKKAGVGQFVLLSAICVQKPLLGFQQAKLAFEAALVASGLTYSIVRPTAFFKSLSGQIERVQQGKPYLLFGDGKMTACKPISDADLGAYLADCLSDDSRHNRILPIGGPGPAITPIEQGEEIFRLLGRAPKYRRFPVGMMDGIIAVLGHLGRLSPRSRDKAELARIGRYYATESMLVLDAESGQYSAAATPETGRDRLFDYYAEVIRGDATVERGDHAVF